MSSSEPKTKFIEFSSKQTPNLFKHQCLNNPRFRWDYPEQIKRQILVTLGILKNCSNAKIFEDSLKNSTNMLKSVKVLKLVCPACAIGLSVLEFFLEDGKISESKIKSRWRHIAYLILRLNHYSKKRLKDSFDVLAFHKKSVTIWSTFDGRSSSQIMTQLALVDTRDWSIWLRVSLIMLYSSLISSSFIES